MCIPTKTATSLPVYIDDGEIALAFGQIRTKPPPSTAVKASVSIWIFAPTHPHIHRMQP